MRGGAIQATPEACEDCLAPPDVMRAILGKTLAVPVEVIDLHYPEALVLDGGGPAPFPLPRPEEEPA